MSELVCAGRPAHLYCVCVRIEENILAITLWWPISNCCNQAEGLRSSKSFQSIPEANEAVFHSIEGR